MSSNISFSSEEVEALLERCFISDEAQEEDYKQLETYLNSGDDQAKAIALRILEERLIRQWFRVQTDLSFIEKVRQRIHRHFVDPTFVDEALARIQQELDRQEGGTAGASLRVKAGSRQGKKWPILIIPLLAGILFFVGLYHQSILIMINQWLFGSGLLSEFSGILQYQDGRLLRVNEKVLLNRWLTFSKDSHVKVCFREGSVFSLRGDGKFCLSSKELNRIIYIEGKKLEGEVIFVYHRYYPGIILQTPQTIIHFLNEGRIRIQYQGDEEEFEVCDGMINVWRQHDPIPLTVKKGQKIIISADTDQIRVEGMVPLSSSSLSNQHFSKISTEEEKKDEQ